MATRAELSTTIIRVCPRPHQEFPLRPRIDERPGDHTTRNLPHAIHVDRPARLDGLSNCDPDDASWISTASLSTSSGVLPRRAATNRASRSVSGSSMIMSFFLDAVLRQDGNICMRRGEPTPSESPGRTGRAGILPFSGRAGRTELDAIGRTYRHLCLLHFS